jgi:L-fuconolactonase
MNRRTFIQTAALLAAGFGRAASAPPRPARLLDAHVHFYDPARPAGVPWPPKSDALLYRTTMSDDFRRAAAAQPADGVIVVEASEWVEDNQWVLDLAARDPLIVGVVGSLRPGTPDFAGQLKRFATNPLFRGIRFRAGSLGKLLDEPGVVADLRRLAEHGLTFDVHAAPAWVAEAPRVARLLPDLRLVINHVAGARVDGRAPPEDWMRTIGELATRPNVWMKVSGLVEGTGRTNGDAPAEPGTYRPVLDALWNAFGAERLIYASNWPVCGRFAPLARVQQIALDYVASKGPAALDRVFWHNARAAYGLGEE